RLRGQILERRAPGDVLGGDDRRKTVRAPAQRTRRGAQALCARPVRGQRGQADIPARHGREGEWVQAEHQSLRGDRVRQGREMTTTQRRKDAKTHAVLLCVCASVRLCVLPHVMYAQWDLTVPRGKTRTIDFTTTEGTFMSLDLSPDGQWIAFDLLGQIYRMPAT